MIKNILRIFKYIQFPKRQLALYLLLTILATIFSVFSLGMLSPFMSIIFKTDNGINTGATGTSGFIGFIKEYLGKLQAEHDQLYVLGATCIIIIIAIVMKNLFLYLSYYVSVPVRSHITSGFRTRLYNKILQLPVSYFTDQKKRRPHVAYGC